MSLAALIRKGGLANVATAIPAIPAIPATQQGKAAATVARIATVAVANPIGTKAEPMPDPAAEGRRQRVLAMLDDDPNTRYAVIVDNPNADPVIVALGIRGQATCELRIQREKFDPFLLLAMIERHGATVH